MAGKCAALPKMFLPCLEDIVYSVFSSFSDHSFEVLSNFAHMYTLVAETTMHHQEPSPFTRPHTPMEEHPRGGIFSILLKDITTYRQ